MNEWQTNWLLEKMQPILECSQLKHLKLALESIPTKEPCAADNLLDLFLSAKEVEGCSQKTISYYRDTIAAMAEAVSTSYTCITTEDLRKYLSDYESRRKVSKVTIDNIRRILSSFFSWLEDEDYIVKSPVRRIHHVKTPQRVKPTITDEEMETLRESCEHPRDLAIVDLLASTGMRIGELVGLNRADIDLNERECLVIGKGDKQRIVYFDARTKLHLASYLETRSDSAPALFVNLTGSPQRVTTGGVESRLKSIAARASVAGIHPHKFRRTLATTAIDKGMPIEQVQKMLGHEKIETTMHYAMVKQSNVKASHRRYLG